jgi:23S rRNA-/tRNA-specific pseudouridylate synthase
MPEDRIGFPPPLLGPDPCRLSILGGSAGWFALEKPVGVLPHAHPGFPDFPLLDRSLQVQREAEKPELLKRTGESAGRIRSTFFLEPDIEGIALFTWVDELRSLFRNQIGSQQAHFRFQLIARDILPEAGAERDCNLPLTDPMPGIEAVRVSHRYGKMAETRFRRIEQFPAGDLSLWSAESRLIRPGQIALHAFECGLRIPGEPLWSREAPFYREDFYKKRQKGRTPFLPGPLIRMQALEINQGDPSAGDRQPLVSILSPEPAGWELLRRRLLGVR